MTPIPRQGQSEDATVLNLVAGQISKLQDSVSTGFRDLSAEISRLRDETVHRREFDRFRDELRIDWTEQVGARDREISDVRATCQDSIRELRESHEKTQARAVSNRRWAVGAVIAASSALAAVVAGAADLLSHLGH